MGNSIYATENGTVSQVEGKERYLSFYSGNTESLVPFSETSYDYDAVGNTVMTMKSGLKTQQHLQFENRCTRVALINDKYTIYIGEMSAAECQEYLDKYFPIGQAFTVTTYLSEATWLSTGATSHYMWPSLR